VRGRQVVLRPLMARSTSLLLCWCVAVCASPPGASDAEIYELAVEWVGRNVEAPKPLLLHPLLIRAMGDTLSLDQAVFNAFDSVSIREVTALDPDFQLCKTDASGLCQVPRGLVAVTLSEIVRASPRELFLGAVVTDGRYGEPKQRYILLQGRAQGASWNITRVNR
jgi:hypothetical protein